MNNESQVLNVPIEDIIPNRFQPRLNFDDQGLQELAASIKEHGIIQPLVLRRLGDKYEIIAGERRYKAAKIAGLTAVPAIITTMDDKKSAEVAIVENVQRRDLSSIEEARSYKSLLDKGYLTQEELATKMGLSQSAISNKLRLLSLSEEVQKALMEGQISERHARSLLKIESEEEQNKWLETILKERLTVRELDKRLKESLESNEVENNNSVFEIPSEPVVEENKQVAAEPVITDIVPPKDVIDPSVVLNPRPITNSPTNKFFNFMEDEAANMSTVEPVINEPIVSEQMANELEVTEPEIKEPSENEEIEMLDFDTPSQSSFEEISFDADVNQLIININNKGYNANYNKETNGNKTKYIIEIEKSN